MSRKTVFGSLLGLVFLVNLGRIVFAPLLRPLGQAFAVTEGTLGLVATLAWLGSALPRIPTGYLLTRMARQRVVLGSGLVLTAATTWTSLASSITELLVGAFLMGLASGAYFVAANPLVSELFPNRVGTAVGLHGTAAQVAAVSAAPLVVLALSVGTWRTSVRLLAVAAALSTVAFVLAARRTDMPAAGTADSDLVGAIRRQWPLVCTAVALVGVAGLLWNGLLNFYVTYFVADGFTPRRANLLLTLAFTAGVPAMALSGRLVDRVPALPLVLLFVGAFVASVVLLTVVEGVVAAGVVSAVVGFAFYSILPALDAYLLGSLPDHHRASAYAVYSGGMTVLQAGGASVVGTLADANVAYDHIFRGMAVATLCVLAVLTGLYLDGRLPNGTHGAASES